MNGELVLAARFDDGVELFPGDGDRCGPGECDQGWCAPSEPEGGDTRETARSRGRARLPEQLDRQLRSGPDCANSKYRHARQDHCRQLTFLDPESDRHPVSGEAKCDGSGRTGSEPLFAMFRAGAGRSRSRDRLAPGLGGSGSRRVLARPQQGTGGGHHDKGRGDGQPPRHGKWPACRWGGRCSRRRRAHRDFVRRIAAIADVWVVVENTLGLVVSEISAHAIAPRIQFGRVRTDHRTSCRPQPMNGKRQIALPTLGAARRRAEERADFFPAPKRSLDQGLPPRPSNSMPMRCEHYNDSRSGHQDPVEQTPSKRITTSRDKSRQTATHGALARLVAHRRVVGRRYSTVNRARQRLPVGGGPLWPTEECHEKTVHDGGGGRALRGRGSGCVAGPAGVHVDKRSAIDRQAQRGGRSGRTGDGRAAQRPDGAVVEDGRVAVRVDPGCGQRRRAAPHRRNHPRHHSRSGAGPGVGDSHPRFRQDGCLPQAEPPVRGDPAGDQPGSCPAGPGVNFRRSLHNLLRDLRRVDRLCLCRPDGLRELLLQGALHVPRRGRRACGLRGGITWGSAFHGSSPSRDALTKAVERQTSGGFRASAVTRRAAAPYRQCPGRLTDGWRCRGGHQPAGEGSGRARLPRRDAAQPCVRAVVSAVHRGRHPGAAGVDQTLRRRGGSAGSGLDMTRTISV